MSPPGGQWTLVQGNAPICVLFFWNSVCVLNVTVSALKSNGGFPGKVETSHYAGKEQGKYKTWECSLSGYQKDKDFPLYLLFSPYLTLQNLAC